ncbi:MAG: glycoside hydrolase family 3 C-terminal domain-containing protein [Bacilli bacterium]|nr:glycoside hydrolase family 3 C-terminal domain-containing protein [Bacilli bacterium]
MKKKLIWPVVAASFLLTACQAVGTNARLTGHFDKFIADFGNSDDKGYRDAAKELNGEIAREGFTLLKNDGTLPFNSSIKKISVFGKASTDLIYNGGGSGQGNPDGSRNVDLQGSLEAVGYELNPNLTSFYKSSQSGSGRSTPTKYDGTGYNTVGETPIANYSQSLKDSFANYNDAAIVLIARCGTEGADEKTCDARDFDSDPFSHKHYLELSKNEEDMLAMVKEYFDKIIIVINSGNAFQCDQFENDEKIRGVLWMGTPGTYGSVAVGEILSGKTNPSGRTVDTWARDFTKDPTFQNFSDNAQTNLVTVNGKEVYLPNDSMLDADGLPVISIGTDKNYTSKSNPRYETKYEGGRATGEQYKVVQGGLNGVKPAAYVEYEEGIYYDYRYYETKYQDMKAQNEAEAEAWYKGEVSDNLGTGVIYPFGYGLSYTTFNQEIVEMNVSENATLSAKNKTIEVKVKVSNVGEVAGKDCVQLYWKAPYISGEIEKADHVLCAFAKTKEIAPGASEEVELSFYLQDVANYDYLDANKNEFKGYELDGGDYSLILAKNAHEFYEAKQLKVGEKGIQYKYDRYTGNEVKNRFTDRNFYNSLPGENDVDFKHMSRADFDGTFPQKPSMEDRKLKEGSRVEEFFNHKFTLADIEFEQVENADGELVDNPYDYMPKAAHKTKEDIEALGWSQRNEGEELAKDERIQLRDMVNIPMDDPKWVEFLNEFTYAELQKFVQDGTFHNPGLDRIGKAQSGDSDGPNIFEKMLWCGEPIIAATYNVDLAKRQGAMVGTEGHQSNTYGWFGPAVNTHRSPFGGRNFEYYSADPFLMGKIAATVVGAATEKGLYCYFKHFAVNDQEKGREGVSTFVSEQALREIYLKSFQMVFQEGHASGVMSSYNRLGIMETAASYPLLTEVLRGEWGFKGAVLSDMTHHSNNSFDRGCYENINNRCLAGCNSQLDNSQYTNDIQAKWSDEKGCPIFTFDGEEYESYSWWYAVRNCAKESLWMTGNSGAFDNEAKQLTLSNEHILVEKESFKLRVGQKFSTTIELDEEAEGELSIDPATPLPEGLSFENNTISGTPKKDCLKRVNILLTNEYEDDNGEAKTEVTGRIIEFNILPNNNEQKGCAGGCNGTMGIVGLSSALGIALAGLLAVNCLRSKKED